MKESKVFILILCFLISIGIFSIWRIYQKTQTEKLKTVESVKIEVQKTLKAGSSYQQVINFLEHLKIENSGSLKFTRGVPIDKIESLNGKEIEFSKDVIEYYVVAIIRNVEFSNFTDWNIQIYFYFDKNKNLLGYRIKKIGVSF